MKHDDKRMTILWRRLACHTLFLALGGVYLSGALAQTTATASETPVAQDSAAPSAKNYGEILKPKVKSPAVIKNQPYAPIKKVDDQANIPEIEMFVGESRIFPAPGVGRIAVGNGQIMTAAAIDNKEVIVFANAVGTSSLFIWNEDGRYQRVKINIVPGDTSRYAREIATFLSAVPNAKASVIGDKVIVEGDNLRDQDLARIDELAKRYPQIVNFTNRIGWEQMVLLDVKVVEFPRNELKEMGLKWAAVGGTAVGAVWAPIRRGDHQQDLAIGLKTGTDNAAPIGPANGGTTYPVPTGLNLMSVLNLGLNAQLALLAQNGKASILAEPQLSARNGAKASFLAGGEYPYTVSSINGPTIMFKPYGIKLDIQPRVDRHGVIRATVESEVSAIDTSFSTAAGPAIMMRKTNTEFNVRSGETIVLSGLLSRKTSDNIDSVPFLGDLPVLGALFRSKRFQNDETELVVFVTPTVVDSQSPGLVDRVERTTQKLQENLGRQPYLSDPIQLGHDPARSETLAAKEPKAAKAPDTLPAPVAAEAPAAVLAASASAKAADTATRIHYRVKFDGANVRAEPAGNAQVLVQLGKESVVAAGPRGVQRGWRQIVVAGVSGWVSAELLEKTDKQPALLPHAAREPGDKIIGAAADGLAESFSVTAGIGQASGQQYRVALDRLPLRAAPDVNAAAIYHLPFGSLVETYAQPTRTGWFAVRIGTRKGWVPGKWLAADAAGATEARVAAGAAGTTGTTGVAEPR